jgi:hypothetical protein
MKLSLGIVTLTGGGIALSIRRNCQHEGTTRS